jgi:hypothetical protein
VTLQSSASQHLQQQEESNNDYEESKTNRIQKKKKEKVEWIYVTHEENSTHQTLWNSVVQRLNTLQPHQFDCEV